MLSTGYSFIVADTSKLHCMRPMDGFYLVAGLLYVLLFIMGQAEEMSESVHQWNLWGPQRCMDLAQRHMSLADYKWSIKPSIPLAPHKTPLHVWPVY